MHLISYVSNSLIQPQMVQAALADINETAVRRNSEMEITGVLFFQNDHFYQVIEGPKPDLDTLFGKLEQDDRHTALNKLVDRPVSERAFADWSMEVFFVDNPDIVNPRTLSLLHALYHENFGADASDLVSFTKHMIDELDTFRIRHTDLQ